MYYDIWGSTPADGDCNPTRFWVAIMAITCFMVSFLCVGMAFGGFTDDKMVFTLYWFLHLLGGASYTLCTIYIPLTRFSTEGKACAALDTVNGDRLKVVYLTHAALYFVYVGGMLSITYFSFLKPSCFGNAAVKKAEPEAEMVDPETAAEPEPEPEPAAEEKPASSGFGF